jgi:glycosyltransferase involved in cell wall biosynthesis
MTGNPRIIFISTMGGGPWGGSEELWSRTALDLVAQGFPVSVSVKRWKPLHPRVLELKNHGIELWVRSPELALARRPWRALDLRHRNFITLAAEPIIAARRAGLVVLSAGAFLPEVGILEMCAARRLPFVTIGQANNVQWWPRDDIAERYRRVLPAVRRCYFVCEANRRLVEMQLGTELPNAEVISNPVNVKYDASPAWPPLGKDGEIRLACVGRLDPTAKGQDILFKTLARPLWMSRPWLLYLYGEGPMREGLERLAGKLGLSDRVVFAGQHNPTEIWALNHALVMPSRYEGLPLAMVEAMLCGRPVIATDVAGHAEIVEDGVTGFLAGAATASSLDQSLERFWGRRAEAEAIGRAGAHRIRRLVPRDPVRIFSDKLRKLAGLT